MLLNIYNLYPGSWGSNCYLLVSEASDGQKQAAVVDPSADARDIVKALERLGARLSFILLTHGHFDHVMALDHLRDISGVPAYIHKDDAEMLPDGEKNAYSFFFGADRRWRPAERLLEDGDELILGNERIKVISTPGHSKGSICLHCGSFLLTGDTLFANGYGRYDLHGGDRARLFESLSALRGLDQGLTIYPGHGDSARLGDALDNSFYF